MKRAARRRIEAVKRIVVRTAEPQERPALLRALGVPSDHACTGCDCVVAAMRPPVKDAS